MGSVSVLFWLAVVSTGVFLGYGSPLPQFRWKIFSYIAEKYVGIGELGQVQGVSTEEAAVFYLEFVEEGLVTVRTTATPKLFLNIEPQTGKLQASPNPDESLKNAVFKLVQPDHSRIHLLMNVSLPYEGSGGEVALSVAKEEEEEGGEPCVMECGIAFDADHSDPIRCQDQQGEQLQGSRDLGLIFQF